MVTVTAHVDLRCRSPRVFNAYDRDLELAHDVSMQEIRSGIPPHVHFVVAPNQSVKGRDGAILTAGTHLEGPEDLAPDGDRPAWRVFDDALWNAVIWENYDWRPPADTHNSAQR